MTILIWNREEYISYMLGEDIGRPMFTELFGPLGALEKEWRAAGVPEDEINLSAFGWDNVSYVTLGCKTGAVTGIKPRIISDTNEEQLLIDRMGRRSRLCKMSATIPLPLEYPVKTMDDWLKVRHWYEFSEDRVNVDDLKAARDKQREGYLVIANIPGGFDEPRQLLGEEGLCIALFDEPEMIEDMLTVIGDTALKVFERVFEYVTIDNLFVHEDMAGKSGPLLGPDHVREFIMPYYTRVWSEVRRHGGRLFSQDSDGNMNPLIDIFLECGINGMHPFEPGSGMDLIEVRKKYGKRLGIKGGIDKYALRGTKDDIRRELEYKMGPVSRGGGVAFALDHRIPNGVPIENYRYYVKLGREILGLPSAKPSPFVRMAF